MKLEAPRGAFPSFVLLLILLFINLVDSAVITGVSPSSGGVAGGTRITISGSGFSDNNNPVGNLVTISGVKCTVVPLHSTINQVVCLTGPRGYTSWNSQVSVVVDGVHTAICGVSKSLCRFSYKNNQTPSIKSIYPTAASAGSLITLSGKVFETFDFEELLTPTREVAKLDVKVSDPQLPASNDVQGTAGTRCSLINPDGNEPYSITSTALTCEVGGPRVAGFYNMSMVQDGFYGLASINYGVYKMSPDGEVYMFQQLADVSSYSPDAGSLYGGTKVSISGEGFDHEDGQTKVYIGFTECHVISITVYRIECILGEIVDVPGPYPGDHGTTYTYWENLYGTYLSSLYDSPNFPDTPTGVWSEQDFMSQRNWNNNFGSRMAGFFRAPITSNYTFYFTSDDHGELYMSRNASRSGLELIASVWGWSHYNQWDSRESQVSRKIWLQRGELYYMEAFSKEGGGGDHVGVGMKIHNNQTWDSGYKEVEHEEQVLDLRLSQVDEVHTVVLRGQPAAASQRVSVTIDPAAGDGGGYTLTALGLTSGLIAVEADADGERTGLTAGALPVSTVTPSADSLVGGVVVREFLIEFLASAGDIPLMTVELNSISSPSSSSVTVKLVSSHVPALAGLSGSFALRWGEKSSSPLGVDATAGEVEAAVEELFSAQCEVEELVGGHGNNSETQSFYRHDLFESAAWSASEEWGGNPSLTSVDPFCGRKSGLFPSSIGYAFLDNHWGGGYDTYHYPYMCMGYKIPEGVLVNMMLLLQLPPDPSSKPGDAPEVEWVSLTLTSSQDQLWAPAVGTWLPLEVGQQWHHKCINLHRQLDASRGRHNHTVHSVAFYSAVEADESSTYVPPSPFYIDEFTISSHERVVTQIAPVASVDPAFSVHDLTRTGLEDGYAWALTLAGEGCDPVLPLLEIDTALTVGSGHVTRTQPPSVSLGGMFDVQHKGGIWVTLPFDASAEEVEEAIVLSGGGPGVQVSRSDGDDCGGISWSITFSEEDGDQPEVVVNGAGLVGTDVRLTVTETVSGGMLVRPITGAYMYAAVDQPTVRVLVHDQASVCETASGSCAYAFTEAATPVLHDVVPSSGGGGDVVTLTGSLLGEAVEGSTVSIGESACVLDRTSLNGTALNCTVGELSAGVYPVRFSSEALGTARSTLTFTVDLAVSSVTPSSGSTYGGTVLTLLGSGFNPEPFATRVVVGGADCGIVSVSFRELVCVTSGVGSAGELGASVVVTTTSGWLGAGAGDISVTAADVFDYDPGVTPSVSSVDPKRGSSGGGLRLTLQGALFGSDAGLVEVVVGETGCAVESVSASELTCTTGVLPPGNHSISVLVHNVGYTSGVTEFESIFYISSISPSVGTLGGGLPVVISGEGFVADSGEAPEVTVRQEYGKVQTVLLYSAPAAEEVQTVRVSSYIEEEVQEVATASGRVQEVQSVTFLSGPPVNEVQEVFLYDVEALEGSVTLWVGGYETAPLPLNASAAEVDAAMEALPLPLPLEVDVEVERVLDDVVWTVTFLTGLDEPLISVDISEVSLADFSLWGYDQDFTSCPPGLSLAGNGTTNSTLGTNSTMDTNTSVRAASARRLGSVDVECAPCEPTFYKPNWGPNECAPCPPHGSDSNTDFTSCVCEEGELFDPNVASCIPVAYASVVVGGLASIDGTYRLALDGCVTSRIPVNASADVIEYALQGLDSIRDVDVEVTEGEEGKKLTITFVDMDPAAEACGASGGGGGRRLVDQQQQQHASDYDVGEQPNLDIHSHRAPARFPVVRREVQYGTAAPAAAAAAAADASVSVSGARQLSMDGVYNPIRIALNSSSLAVAQLDPSLESYLLDLLLPMAISWVQAALRVIRTTSNLRVAAAACGKVPLTPYDQTVGYADADFILYVTSGSRSAENATAWSAACSRDQYGRPTAAQLHIDQELLDVASAAWPQQEGLVIHHLLQALGFGEEHFDHFIDDDGVPRGAAGVVRSVLIRGHTVRQVITPRAVAVARQHFGCDSLEGVDLEGEEGGGGVAGSLIAPPTHWDKRLMKDDVMGPSIPRRPVYSAITLALLEDSGWYRANFQFASFSAWGYKAGCKWVEEACLGGDPFNPTPSDSRHFCTHASQHSCSLDGFSRAACAVGAYADDVPAAFQYFADPVVGGTDIHMDYCPYYEPMGAGDCRVAANAPLDADYLYGEVYGAESRCFVTDLFGRVGTGAPAPPDPQPRCFQFSCTDGVYQLLVQGSAWLECPAEGGYLDIGSGFGGHILCPAFEDVCGGGAGLDATCPASCSNRGTCNNGICYCQPGYYGDDCSQEVCPNNCNHALGLGRCDSSSGYPPSCACVSDFAGDDCEQLFRYSGDVSRLEVMGGDIAGNGVLVTVEEEVKGSAPTAGSFTLSYQGETTEPVAHDVSPFVLQAALNALPNLGSIRVSRSGAPNHGFRWRVTFEGAAGDVPTLQPDGAGLSGGHAGVSVREAVKGVVLGGNFKLSLGEVSTPSLPSDISAEEMESELGTACQVPVTVSYRFDHQNSYGREHIGVHVWAVTFNGYSDDWDALVGDGMGLTGITPTVETRVEVNGALPLAGSFTLSYGGSSTPPLPHDVGEEALATALRGLEGVRDVRVERVSNVGMSKIGKIYPFAWSVSFTEEEQGEEDRVRCTNPRMLDFAPFACPTAAPHLWLSVNPWHWPIMLAAPQGFGSEAFTERLQAECDVEARRRLFQPTQDCEFEKVSELREYCGTRTGVAVGAPCWVNKWTEANATRLGQGEGESDAVVFRRNDRFGPTLWQTGFLFWERVDMEEDSALLADASGLTGASVEMEVEVIRSPFVHDMAVELVSLASGEIEVVIPEALTAVESYADILLDNPVNTVSGYWRLGRSDGDSGIENSGEIQAGGEGHFRSDRVNATVSPGMGFSKWTGDDSLLLPGRSTIEIGYHYGLNAPEFAVEVWLQPIEVERCLDGDLDIEVAAALNAARKLVVTSVGEERSAGYLLTLTPDQRPQFWLGMGGERPVGAGQVFPLDLVEGDWSVVVGPVVALDSWTHVALSFDGSTQCLYVDGVPTCSDLGPAVAFAPNNQHPLFIGADAWVAGSVAETGQTSFCGYVDELVVYANALSPSYVSSHASFGTSVSASVRVGFGDVQAQAQCVGAGTGAGSRAGCDFVYSPPLTPRVGGVTPARGQARMSVEVWGENFGSSASGVTVYVGDTECGVTSFSASSINCTVGDVPLGPQPVHLYVDGVGRSVGTAEFVHDLHILDVSPTAGSLLGGTVLTIVGTGFSTNLANNEVMLGGAPCELLTADYAELTCVTPPALALALAADMDMENLPASLNAVIEVAVTAPVAGALFKPASCPDCAFTYEAASTPTVTDVSPVQVSEGTTLTISGTSFSSTAGDMEVVLGSEVCATSSSGPTSLECKVPFNEGGFLKLSVRVGGGANLGGASVGAAFAFLESPVSFHATNLSPGSLGGGSIMVLGGEGFSNTPDAVSVRVGGKPCEVIASNLTSISCAVPPASREFPLTHWELLGNSEGVATEWVATDTSLTQLLNSGTGSISCSADHIGSWAVAGEREWDDYILHTSVYTGDNDGLGFIVRYTDPFNYIKYEAVQQESCHLLISVVAGDRTVLAQWAGGYDRKTWFDVEIRVNGRNFTALFDGSVVAEHILPGMGREAVLPRGKVGVATWKSVDVTFKDTHVVLGTHSNPGLQPVTVSVNGLDGSCDLSLSDCSYSYSDALTPVVASLDPVSGDEGTAVTLSGTGFVPGAMEVWIGDIPCEVSSSSATSVDCVAGANSAGPHLLSVRADGVHEGVVNANATFDHTFTLSTSSSFTSGSFGGGTEVVVEGTGFSSDMGEMSVRVCGRECDVTSSSFSRLTCTTTPYVDFSDAADTHKIETPVQNPSDDMVVEVVSGLSDRFDWNVDMTVSGTQVALRFDNVQIPQGAVVNSAQIMFFAGGRSCGSVDLEIQAEVSANANPFPGIDFPLDNRVLGDERVSWSPGLWAWEGDTEETSDIASLLNSIVSMEEWEKGNAMVFVVSHVSGSGSCLAKTYENDPEGGGAFAARLVADYTPANFMAIFNTTSQLLCDVEVAVSRTPALELAPGCNDGGDGTVGINLALGRVATSSLAGGEEPLLAVDGDDTTIWTSAVSNETDSVEWVVDLQSGTEEGGLGRAFMLSRVSLLFGQHPPKAYTLEASLDAVTWQVVGQEVGSFGYYDDWWFGGVNAGVTSPRVAARYVRLVMTEPWDREYDGSPLYSIAEVTVTGCPMAAPSMTLADQFEYRVDLTPLVTAISPDSGSTAGGTRIEIRGLGFSSLVADNSVSIGGIPCEISSADATSIVCVTGATSVIDGGWKVVSVSVAGKGDSAPMSALYRYIDKWSAKTTWGGLDPPVGCGDWGSDKNCKDSVVIPEGQLVLMDISPPRFYLLLIMGKLEFGPDAQDLALQATYILVRGGTLEIGTEDAPFQNQASITLYGHQQTLELPIFGAKVLAVYRGTLDIHGVPRVSWTRLAATAVSGSSEISLLEPVDWEVNAYIVVASTHWEKEQAEVVTVKNVSPDGLTVYLNEALAHEHLGETHYFDGGFHEVEIRAEVGLLSRNIVIQGDSESNNCIEVNTPGLFSCNQFGGHVFLHSPGDESLTGRITNTEFRNMGQAFRLGRYALHYHMIGDVRNSYATNNTFHSSHNRAVALHGVNYLTIAHNVAFHVKGHSYFIEDGIEMFNMLDGNLACMTLPSNSLLNTDQTPTSFWITNPHNYVRNNAAAGSENYGFWYRAELAITGSSAGTPGVCPKMTPLLEFRDNTAHSNGRYGLRIFDVWQPQKNGCDGGGYETAHFYRMLSYRNNVNGVTCTSIAQIAFIDFQVVENIAANFEYRHLVGEWGEIRVQDSLIVQDMLTGTALPWGFSGRAVWGPIDHGLSFENVTFENFVGTGAVHSCAVCGRGGSPAIKAGGMEMRFSDIKWVNSPNRGNFRWKHEGILFDVDGTFTESGIPKTTVVATTGLLPEGHCHPINAFSRNLPASICHDVSIRRVGLDRAMPNSIAVEDLVVSRYNHTGEIIPITKKPNPTHSFGFMFALAVGYRYVIGWNTEAWFNVDLESYRTGISELAPEEHLYITHEFLQWKEVDVIGRPLYYAQVGELNIKQETNMTDGTGLALPTEPHGSWTFQMDPEDDLGGELTYMVRGCDGLDRCVRDINVKVHPCPEAGCWPPPPPPPPPPPQNKTAAWSEPETWNGTLSMHGNPHNAASGTDPTKLEVEQVWGDSIPSAGDNVWIPSWKTVVLDVDTPIVNHLIIDGELFFNTTLDLTLQAVYIELRGGGTLRIGSEEEPYEKKANIILHGDRNTEVVNRGVEIVQLSAKVLAVFGGLELWGKPPSQSWARLASTAEAGSSSVVVDAVLDWAVGDEIVIAPTGYEPFEVEQRTISSVSVDEASSVTSLFFQHPLEHRHFSASYEFGTRGMETRGEVGLLTRHIVVQGGEVAGEYASLDEEEFGCRVIVGTYTDKYDDCSSGECYEYEREQAGYAHISGVEMMHCGQNGITDKYSLLFHNMRDTGAGSFLADSSIHAGFHTAIGVQRSSFIQLRNNVVYKTVGDAVVVDGGSASALVTDNLVVMAHFFGTYRNNDQALEEWPEIMAGIRLDGRGYVATGNTVAGSERAAFRGPGVACAGRESDSSSVFENNVAHSSWMGFFTEPSSLSCVRVQDFTAWKIWLIGVWQEHSGATFEMERVHLADNKLAIDIHVIGPPPLSHVRVDKTVLIKDTLVIGQSDNFDCVTDYTRPVKMCQGPKAFCWGGGRHNSGMYLPSFNGANNMYPKLSPPYTTGHYQAIGGYTLVDGVTFARFGENACGVRDVAFENNPTVPDGTHPTGVKNLELVEVEHDSLALIHPPNPGWITQDDCVDMDCDGPKHIVIEDLDGTLQQTIVARAEFFNTKAIGAIPPFAMFVDVDGVTHTESEIIYNGYGIPREGCSLNSVWNAWSCPEETGLTFTMLVIESLDADTETRRLSPLALSSGGWTDLINGPQDHGWCFGYTCLKRISTFNNLVVNGRDDYSLYMSGTNPEEMRLHMLNAEEEDAIVVNIFYTSPNKLLVYAGGEFVEDLNYIEGKHKADLFRQGLLESYDGEAWPTLADSNGVNAYNRLSRMIIITLKGPVEVTIKTMPVVFGPIWRSC